MSTTQGPKWALSLQLSDLDAAPWEGRAAGLGKTHYA